MSLLLVRVAVVVGTAVVGAVIAAVARRRRHMENQRHRPMSYDIHCRICNTEVQSSKKHTCGAEFHGDCLQLVLSKMVLKTCPVCHLEVY